MARKWTSLQDFMKDPLHGQQPEGQRTITPEMRAEAMAKAKVTGKPVGVVFSGAAARGAPEDQEKAEKFAHAVVEALTEEAVNMANDMIQIIRDRHDKRGDEHPFTTTARSFAAIIMAYHFIRQSSQDHPESVAPLWSALDAAVASENSQTDEGRTQAIGNLVKAAFAQYSPNGVVVELARDTEDDE